MMRTQTPVYNTCVHFFYTKMYTQISLSIHLYMHTQFEAFEKTDLSHSQLMATKNKNLMILQVSLWLISKAQLPLITFSRSSSLGNCFPGPIMLFSQIFTSNSIRDLSILQQLCWPSSRIENRQLIQAFSPLLAVISVG